MPETVYNEFLEYSRSHESETNMTFPRARRQRKIGNIAVKWQLFRPLLKGMQLFSSFVSAVEFHTKRNHEGMGPIISLVN